MGVYKKAFFLLVFLASMQGWALEPLPQNNYLVFANVIDEKVGLTNRSDFFRRMLTYVDNSNTSVDSFMDSFIFVQSKSFLSTAGDFGSCTTTNNCTFPSNIQNYYDTYFNYNGYLDALHNAENMVKNNLGITFSKKTPQISVYFSIPFPYDEAVTDSGIANPIYMDNLNRYLIDIKAKFDLWKANNPSSLIKFRGFYFGRENLKTYGPDEKPLLLNDGLDQTNSFLVTLKHRVLALDSNLELISSPYQNYYGNFKLATSYENRENSIFNGGTSIGGRPIFDNAYIQPNAFHGGFKFTNIVDKEMIRWTYMAYSDNPYTAFNIETNDYERFQTDGVGKEFYPEIINYVDYAKYLGLTKKTLMYYDGGHAHYDNSQNPNRHWIYKEAYKLAKRGRDGDIINGGFESFDLMTLSSLYVGGSSTALSSYDKNNLLNWVGNYAIGHNTQPSIDAYHWTTSGSQKPLLGNFLLKPNIRYVLRFNVAENIDDSVTFSGIAIWRFFDAAGNQIVTGDIGNNSIKYSSYVNGWYHYVSSSSSPKYIAIPFSPPPGTVQTKLLLGNWNDGVELIWKNVNIQKDETNIPLYVIGKSNEEFVTRDLDSFGQYAQLALDAYISTEDAFRVTSNLSYSLTFDSQIPDNSCSSNNGVAGVKFYDKTGAQIKGAVDGLKWSSFLDVHYHYFTAKPFQQSHSLNFIAPTEARTAKVYFRNWNCESNILVDNIKLDDATILIDELGPLGSALGIDQSNLIRLNANNSTARFRINLSDGVYNELSMLTRSNCTKFDNVSCQSSLELEYLYLDSSGNIIFTSKETEIVKGSGELYPPESENNLLVYSHWNLIERTLVDLQAKQLVLTVTLRESIDSEEVLLNRPHVK